MPRGGELMATRRRIRTFIRKTTGGGGGGPSPGGTINWGPSYGQSLGDDDSTFNVNATLNLDSFGLIGNTTATGAVTMPALAIEGTTVASGAVTIPELAISGGTTAAANISATVGIDRLIAAEDTYLDQASAGTSFGGATSLLAKTTAAVGSNAQVAYLAWDLTWAPLTGTINSAVIHVWAQTSTVLGENGNFAIHTAVAKPFNEGTATWTANEPITGTNTETISKALTTTLTEQVLTLNATTLASARGRWLWIRLLGTAALGLNTITVASKENATSGNRPYMELNVTL